MENTQDTSNKINFILHKINNEIESYKTIFSNIQITQEKIINIFPENFKSKLISINDFRDQDNKIKRKIESISNFNYLIEKQIETSSLKYISEKLLLEFYNNLKSVNSILDETKIYLLEINKLTNTHYVNNNSYQKIHENILEFGENSVKSSINQDLSTMLDSRTKIFQDIDIIENMFKDLNTDFKNIIRIDEEIKSREALINENLVESIDAEKDKVIQIFNHEASRLFNTIKNNYNKFELDLKEANNSLKNMKDSVISGINDVTDLNDRIVKLDIEFSKKINEKFIQINDDFEKKAIEITQNLIQKIKEIDDQFNALRTRVTTKSKRIQNSHDDFIQVVERAGIYELTQNYKNKSIEEKKDYNFFSWATIIAISLAIITTIVIIVIPIIEHWGANPPVETNYFTILARLSISLMFFVLAVYTSKQSSKHYECYQENHRTFLQLAALEPFMARMSEEEQKAIRKGLIPIYFNQNIDGKFASKGEELGMQFNMQAFVEKFFEVGKNITDKDKTDQSKPNGQV